MVEQGVEGAPATLNLRNVLYYLLRALNQVDVAQHRTSASTTQGHAEYLVNQKFDTKPLQSAGEWPYDVQNDASVQLARVRSGCVYGMLGNS